MALVELSERIEKFVKHTKMSVRKFASECGLKQPTLDKHIRGTADPNAVTLTGIAKRFPELSLEWLLLGEGDMLKSKLLNDQDERTMKLVDVIATLQETINTKNDTIAALNDRIQQLENQLNNR